MHKIDQTIVTHMQKDSMHFISVDLASMSLYLMQSVNVQWKAGNPRPVHKWKRMQNWTTYTWVLHEKTTHAYLCKMDSSMCHLPLLPPPHCGQGNRISPICPSVCVFGLVRPTLFTTTKRYRAIMTSLHHGASKNDAIGTKWLKCMMGHSLLSTMLCTLDTSVDW